MPGKSKDFPQPISSLMRRSCLDLDVRMNHGKLRTYAPAHADPQHTVMAPVQLQPLTRALPKPPVAFGTLLNAIAESLFPAPRAQRPCFMLSLHVIENKYLAQ